MGIRIYAANSTNEFYMGYGGFFWLRSEIASVLDKEFGANYSLLIYCHTTEQFAENDKIANSIIAEKKLDEDIVNFLYQPDTDGKIKPRVCKKLYNLIKDVDFGKKRFQYAAYSHNDYEDFKEFLKECWKKHRYMRWR